MIWHSHGRKDDRNRINSCSPQKCFLRVLSPQTSLNPNNYLLSLVVSAGLTALMGYRQVYID